MISKELLSISLKSAYSSLLSIRGADRLILFKSDPLTYNSLLSIGCEDQQRLKSEILSIGTDDSIFSNAEISEHLKTFQLMERLSKKGKVCCHIDGSVRINYDDEQTKTGKRIVGAGASYIVESSEEVLLENGFPLPVEFMNEEMTSHIAEYHALLSCLSALTVNYPNPKQLDIEIESDSEVLCSQMNYSSRTRNLRHKYLKEKCWELIPTFNSVTFKQIPREENHWADRLARTSYHREHGWYLPNDDD